jgi:signal transduction histidine kinase
VAAAPVRVGTRTTGAVMVATDVTARKREEEERKLLYEQARQAVADREHALAVVSHDLRSPLNTVGLAATMLAAEVATDGARKAVGSITRGVGRMSRLISDLLDFSSIQAGRLSVRPALVDAASIVEEALETVRGEADNRGLELRKDITSVLVRADRDRLLQALGNLLGNAIKATAAGFVAVSLSIHDDQALFSVRDSGPGVPPDQQERIFEPYWRAKNPTYKGTGLGLAITQAIVLAHGGAIWLESHPGEGAVFNFTIPDVDTSQHAAGSRSDAGVRGER